MSRRYMVAYIATDGGVDALRFAIAAANGRDATLDIVMAMTDHGVTPGEYPRDHSYGSIIENQVGEWLEDARTEVPVHIPTTTRLTVGENVADTLIEQVEALGSQLLVVGSQGGGIFKRVSLGTVVNQLIERSRVPIAVAPRGYNYPGPIRRITALDGILPAAGTEGLEVREVTGGTSISEWLPDDVAVIAAPNGGLLGGGVAQVLRDIPVPTIILPGS